MTTSSHPSIKTDKQKIEKDNSDLPPPTHNKKWCQFITFYYYKLFPRNTDKQYLVSSDTNTITNNKQLDTIAEITPSQNQTLETQKVPSDKQLHLRVADEPFQQHLETQLKTRKNDIHSQSNIADLVDQIVEQYPEESSESEVECNQNN